MGVSPSVHRSDVVRKMSLLSSVGTCMVALTPLCAAAQTAPAPNPSPATASAPASAGEVIVTAQRRSELILKVPVAVSAITGSQLEKLGVTQVNSLSSLIPNLQVNDPTGGVEPNFTLRGIGIGNAYDDNQASPIGVYVDDAYLSFRATQGGQLFDLDRVEVLRGPQGTLYGRNTTGGAINFITHKPSLSGTDGYLELGYGNYNDYRAQGAFEDTLIDGVLGVRASFDYEKHDGYIHNTYPGQPDLENENNLSSRLDFRYKPTSKLDVNLKLYTEQGKQIQPGIYQIGDGPGGENPITGYSRGNLGFYDVDSDHPHSNSTRQNGAELTAKYQISDDLSIQSLTEFDVDRSLLGQDVDGSPIDLVQVKFASRYEEANQELRLVYSGEKLNLQGGVYYGWDRASVNNFYDILGFLGALGVPADPTFTTGGGTILQHYDQTRTSAAVFGQADYKLTDRFTATIGLRYTSDHATFTNGDAYVGDYNGNPLVQTVGAPGNPLKESGTDSAVTGRAALNYRFDWGQIVYASYSRGYRAGAFNGGGYLSPTQVNFVQPETVNAYEIGTKGRALNGALTFAAAAFYYDYQNQQILDMIGVVGFLRNAAASTVKGIELESTAHVNSSLSATVSLGLLQSRYDSLNLQGFNLEGNRLPFAPSVTTNARIDWILGQIAGGVVTLTPSVTYTSKIYFSAFNNVDGNSDLSQKDYVLTDASLEWVHQKWAVRLWAKNIFATQYFSYGINLSGTTAFNYLNEAPPRTFGVSVRRAF